MSYFIIIRGPAGVGKSTLAKDLSQRLAARYIPFDQILAENNLDSVSPGADGISEENFIQANLKAIPEAMAMLAFGVPVVFDGCFYRAGQYEHLKKNLPNKHLVFSLQATVDECIARDAERKNPIGQEAVRAVYNMVSAVELGIPLDASEAPETVIAVMLKKIEALKKL